MGYKDPDKQREYQRNWAAEKKRKLVAKGKDPGINKRNGKQRAREFILDYKKDKPCLDCGIVYPPPVMEFDHRPEESKWGTIARMASAGLGVETIYKEIQKCDLVCANCHRIRGMVRGFPNDPVPSPYIKKGIASSSEVWRRN